MTSPIPSQRLRNQRITRPHRSGPADVVAWLGAVQSQEYQAAKWAIALRMSGTTRDEEIERAFDEGQILRTHILRPTWHFVTRADIRWMLALTAPHVQRRAASYYRRHGLDGAVVTRAMKVIERALMDGRCLTRAELAECLRRARLQFDSLRLMLLMLYVELEGLVCSGPRRRKHHTYALLSDRVPAAPSLSRDEGLAELTRRYFASHGPATIRDFVWWSGLSAADAKRGLEMCRARTASHEGFVYWTIGPAGAVPAPTGVYLLPIYDEYLVAYRDRAAVPHTATTINSRSGRVAGFQNAVVIGGQIAGTWRPQRQRHGAALEVAEARRFTASERRGLGEAAERYGRFLDCPVSILRR